MTRVIKSDKIKRVKLQSRIPLSTRYRLVKVAEALNVSGTQAVSDLILQEYQEYLKKRGDYDGTRTT